MGERLDIVLGGHLENAMIRRFDEVVMPERNSSTSLYYAALNRKVDKSCQDLADTFLALAEKTIVSGGVDWNMPYVGEYGPFHASDFQVVIKRPAEEDQYKSELEGIREFATLLHVCGALSARSLARAGVLDLKHYPNDDFTYLNNNRQSYEHAAVNQYIERLLHQVTAAQDVNTKLILPEDDILVLQEIINFVDRTSCLSPIDLPDLRTINVLKAEPIGAVINFSAFDAYNLKAVRLDNQIDSYAREVGAILKRSNINNVEDDLLQSMITAHTQSEAGRRAQSVYEILGFVVKPLHYLPIISGLLTIPEDIRDVVMMWVNRRTNKNSWYLLGPRMKEISIKEYLNRKGNLIS